MNYAMLIAAKGTPGAVATWVNNSLIANDVPEIVLEAESWIYRRLRHWRMLTPPYAGTMSAGTDNVAYPADMIEPFLFWTTGIYFQIMPMRPVSEVIANWSYDGAGARVQQRPQMYYFDQSAIRFDSPPDQNYPYNMIYYQQLAPLATSGSNFLTDTYPRLMRCACMAAACEWMKDSGQGNYDRTYWDTLAQDALDAAQAESDRSKRAVQAGAIIMGGGIPGYAAGFPSWRAG